MSESTTLPYSSQNRTRSNLNRTSKGSIAQPPAYIAILPDEDEEPWTPSQPLPPKATRALQNLETQVQALETSRSAKPRDKSLIATRETLVYNAMLRVSEVHPDPQFRIEYRIRAEEFRSGDEKARRSVAAKVGLGVGAVVFSPVIITGASLLLAGGIVLGTGRALAGAGHAMTGGKLLKYGWIPGSRKAKPSAETTTPNLPQLRSTFDRKTTSLGRIYSFGKKGDV